MGKSKTACCNEQAQEAAQRPAFLIAEDSVVWYRIETVVEAQKWNEANPTAQRRAIIKETDHLAKIALQPRPKRFT